jgi:hypothetical protein
LLSNTKPKTIKIKIKIKMQSTATMKKTKSSLETYLIRNETKK